MAAVLLKLYIKMKLTWPINDKEWKYKGLSLKWYWGLRRGIQRIPYLKIVQ